VNIQWTFREHSVNIQWTFREHSVNIEWTFSEHSGNIQGTFREHSGNIQWTDMEEWKKALEGALENLIRAQVFREHSVNIQWTFRERSVNIEWTFSEHSGNIQGTFREHSVNVQWTDMEEWKKAVEGALKSLIRAQVVLYYYDLLGFSNWASPWNGKKVFKNHFSIDMKPDLESHVWISLVKAFIRLETQSGSAVAHACVGVYEKQEKAVTCGIGIVNSFFSRAKYSRIVANEQPWRPHGQRAYQYTRHEVRFHVRAKKYSLRRSKE
jgi:hypothetical protein